MQIWLFKEAIRPGLRPIYTTVLDTSRKVEMEPGTTHMTISELSAQSGIPVSTIKFYIRKNLLPGPIKTGQTRGYYTIRHLNRLALVQKMKKEERMPLEKIREIVQMIDHEIETEMAENTKPSIGRSEIVEVATPLFREKGYEAVTIRDVINTAGIGKSTFYKHFLNKKEVFLACVETILSRQTASLGISGVDDEKDILKVFDKYSELFYITSPLWRDVINMLRSAAIYNPEEFTPKLEEVIQLKIQRYKKRVRKGIQRGIFRHVNDELFAVMIMGIEEYCSEYTDFLLKNDQEEEAQREKIHKEVKDILLYGVLKREDPV
jgi:AcrR family transcriptional regulator